MSTIVKLIISFLQVGLFSVGGGYAAIPLIQNQVVDTFHLMSMSQFTDLITIAEMTPGPISINSATFVGIRTAGLPGAMICTIAGITCPFILSLILAHFYYKYRNLSGVQTVLAALRPAVVALIASAGMSILLLALFNANKSSLVLSDFRIVEFLLFVVGFVLLRKYKLNAITIIFGTGVVGTGIYLLLGVIA